MRGDEGDLTTPGVDARGYDVGEGTGDYKS